MKSRDKLLSIRCNYQARVTTWQERDVGCPLDHCACGTHDVNNEHHDCNTTEYDDEVTAAEHAAGWYIDP
jgi:hypothetical protein